MEAQIKRRGRPPGSKNKANYVPVDEVTEILAQRLLPFVGKAVQYYDEGWRAGNLVAVGNTHVLIKHSMTGDHKIPVEDVRVIE